MSEMASSISRKSLWTVGSYVASLGFRFTTSIVLARLLGPEILGIMVIAQAVRAGSELLTDVGLEQNVVSSEDGNEPSFLNTAWTLQIARGIVISIVCASLAPALAKFYSVPASIFFAMSAAPLLNSLASTSIFQLSKNVDVKKRNLFEMLAEFTGLLINVALALALPSAWAPVLGVLLSLAARSSFSYLLPHPRHRLILHSVHVRAIFHYGKWIMLSSLALYASTYIDRLYLGRVVDIAVIGVYGLARNISDLPHALAGRFGFQIVFPVMAAHHGTSREAARIEVAPARGRFLLLVAVGIATIMAWSDYAVSTLYDRRYDQAAWMLLLLLGGSWVAVLAAVNEAAVFGCSKPQIVSLANFIRIVVMVAILPLGFATWGLPGAILALGSSEFARYVVFAIAQRRLRTALFRQDLAVSICLLVVLGAWIFIREVFGLSSPWSLLLLAAVNNQQH